MRYSTAHELPEAYPGFAVEAHELDLFYRIEIGRAGVDTDAGQQSSHFEILQIRAEW